MNVQATITKATVNTNVLIPLDHLIAHVQLDTNLVKIK